MVNKSPEKVDCSAAFGARYVAKNIVAAGLAAKCSVQLAYAIGIAKPFSIYIDTFGTGKVPSKKLEKIDRIEIPPEQRLLKFEFSEPPRSGEDVFSFENLEKSWELPGGGLKPVFSGVSGLIRRQQKIAVVGVNGAGKSTFLKILAGQTAATGGSLTTGASVELGYFSQHALDVLDPSRTVYETVEAALPDATIGVIRNLCAAFLFTGDTVDKRISSLSGGERSRVVLATLLARPLNVLILDEPTNHLDIQSREILLEALKNYSGTVILVSHDRHFLRHLVNRVFEIDHGELRAYEGDYEYYLGKAAELAA
ncbi:MAG: putative ABC transporter ATP-binding protein [Deltaproteobacteria bacterium ADurb.Bin510]|nr:MAG: putative ABC transporter ATP-binding protein [Deltaproteobacteria bacterium ADurb.Bin510]